MKKVLVLMCLLTLLTGCGKELKPNNQPENNTITNEEGTKINNSAEFNKTKTYKTYEISDAKIQTTKEGRTTFTANVKNTSSQEVEGALVNIILVDRSGNKVSNIATYIRSLQAGEVMALNAGIDQDLSNAYNFYFEEYNK